MELRDFLNYLSSGILLSEVLRLKKLNSFDFDLEEALSVLVELKLVSVERVYVAPRVPELPSHKRLQPQVKKAWRYFLNFGPILPAAVVNTVIGELSRQRVLTNLKRYFMISEDTLLKFNKKGLEVWRG